jgi:hypothetical protein
MHVALFFIFCQIFDPGATGYTFVKLGVGVRPVAMANAFTALSDDGNAVFWNPSGLGIVSSYYVAGMLMNHLTYFNYYNLTSAIPVSKNSAVGIGLSYLGASDIEYSERGEEIGGFTNSDMLLNVGYGRSIGKRGIFSFGGAVKLVRGQLYRYSSYGVLADLGLLFNPVKYLYFGTVLKNLGTPRRYIEKWEYPPVNFRQGVALKLPIKQNQFTLSFDCSVYPDFKPTFSVGTEMRIRTPGLLGLSGQKQITGFAIMAGYQSGYGEGTFSGLSVGFTVELSLMEGLYLDIGALLLSYGYLGTSERIALGLNYVPTRERASKSSSQSGRSKS